MATKTRKPKRKPSKAETKCANCGLWKSYHYSVNFADGPFVGGETLVCPSSIYCEEPR